MINCNGKEYKTMNIYIHITELLCYLEKLTHHKSTILQKIIEDATKRTRLNNNSNNNYASL